MDYLLSGGHVVTLKNTESCVCVSGLTGLVLEPQSQMEKGGEAS